MKRETGSASRLAALASCFALVLLAVSTAKPAYADNWRGISGAVTLRELVTDMTVEIELKPGVTATGEYYANGTARIEAWGETFLRNWHVSGDDQVCYSSATGTECYTFEQNLDVPGEYRIRHTETGDLTAIRIMADLWFTDLFLQPQSRQRQLLDITAGYRCLENDHHWRPAVEVRPAVLALPEDA